MKKFNKLIYALFGFLIIFISVLTVYAITPASEPILQGIDVSDWQEYINYQEVRNSGIEVVYIKASQGSNIKDPYFDVNYENAKANGLKVGFYHFLTATNISEAQKEAQFFAHVISGKSPDCRLVMDYEVFQNASREQINEIARNFLESVQRLTNKEVMLYSDLSNAQNTFGTEISDEYPLWLAYYGDYQDLINVQTSWNVWIGQQYTDRGIIERNKWICR